MQIPGPVAGQHRVAVLGALALELDRQRRDLQVEVVDELEAAGGIKGAALWSSQRPAAGGRPEAMVAQRIGVGSVAAARRGKR
jgi:hypothetical protein